jgi:hypothetical protein
MKSKIRYLIDCELSDINEEVMAACRAVCNAVDENKGFYLSVDNFVKVA